MTIPSTITVSAHQAAASGSAIVRGGASENPAVVYLAEVAPGSRRRLLGALNLAASIASGGAMVDAFAFPWAGLRAQHTSAIMRGLREHRSERTGEPLAPATINLAASAIRGVLKAAWRLGAIPADDYHKAAAIKGVRGSRVERGRALERRELAALFQACASDPSAHGRRDAAMLAILAYGLRRAELTGLRLEDYDPSTGRLIVRGKGNKERAVYIVQREAVAAWLRVRGDAPGALVSRVRRDGTPTIDAITEQAVYAALRRRAEQAGVRAFSPHDLRRTFAGELLGAGADISTVQRLMGHASPTTTARYDRRGEQVRRDASALLAVPYIAPAA